MSASGMEPMDAARLLEHDRFVRGLARRLLADPVRADDVVQDAWLAALQRPPRHGWSLKAWLAGVVRNRSRNVVREEARRGRRERVAARTEASGSTAELLAHEARRKDVIDAVLALSEPQREIVLLRFFDGLAPREIARRLGVPGSTVRTRLARALDRLRAALQARYGGDREWCLALVPVAAPARLPFAALLAGVIGMKTKIAAVVVVLAGFAALFALRGEKQTPRSERAQSETQPAATVVAARTGAAERPSDPRPRPGSTPLLHGRVTADEPFDPREVTVVVQPETGPVLRHALDAATFRLALPQDAATAKLTIRAEHLRLLSETLTTTARTVQLRLRPAAFVTGTVAGTDGDADALLALYRLGDGATPDEQPAAVGRSGGGFRLGVTLDGPHLLVAVRKGYAPWSTAVRLNLRETFTVPPIELRRGLGIGGRVTLSDGAVLAGIEVEVRQAEEQGKRLELPGSTIRYAKGRVHLGAATVRTDTDGAYRATGLATGAFAVSCSGAPGCHPGALLDAWHVPEYRRSASAPSTDVDFVVGLATLDLGCTAGGNPRPDTRVEVFQRMYIDGGLKWWSNEQYTTDKAGRLRLLVRPGTHYVVESREPEFEPARRETTTPEAGKQAELILALEPAAPTAGLALRIVPDAGATLPGQAAITLRKTGAPASERGKRRVAAILDGRCVVRGIRPGDYTVTVRLGARHGKEVAHFLDAALQAQLRPGQTVERTVNVVRGGRIELTVRGPDGRTDLSCNCTILNAGGEELDVLYTKFANQRMMSLRGALPDLTGPAHIDRTLPAGRYTIRVEPLRGGYAPREFEVEVEPGKTAKPVLELR